MDDQLAASLEQAFKSNQQELALYENEIKQFKQQLNDLSNIRSALNCRR
jgi:hypothetical protein